MDGCPFCDRIAAGEYDYSDAHAVAFQPLNPVVPGHFLVVPRRHMATALEPLAPILLGGAMRLAAILARQMDLTDCNFINSAGPAATQTVMHLHVHVVPRREGDGLHLPWTGQNAWPERCGYCYCPLADAPECADGCAHRDLVGYVGCARPLAAPSTSHPRRSERKPTRAKGSAAGERTDDLRAAP
jgi:histidine triad (HIT) family protein